MFWRNLWMRIQSLGFLVFLAIVGAGAALLFLPLRQEARRMQQEIAQKDAELTRLEQVQAQQKAEIEALKTDPSYVERIARSKLNLAKPAETIFRFESNAVPMAATAPAPRSTR